MLEGERTVENNTFGSNTFFWQMANSVNSDGTLAFDLMGKGTAVDEGVLPMNSNKNKLKYR